MGTTTSKKTPAAQLAAEIERRGLTINAAGALIKAPVGALSRLLREDRRPGLRLALAIEDEFGLPARAWLSTPAGRRRRAA